MSQENVDVVRRIWDLSTEGIEKGDPAAGFNAAYDARGLIFCPIPPSLRPLRYRARRRTWAQTDSPSSFAPGLTNSPTGRCGPTRSSTRATSQVVAIVRQLATGKGSGATVELRFAVVYTLGPDRSSIDGITSNPPTPSKPSGCGSRRCRRRTWGSCGERGGICSPRQRGRARAVRPGDSFRVYQKAAKRRERLSGAYLAAFDRALHWAEIGRIGAAEGDGSSRSPIGRPEHGLTKP